MITADDIDELLCIAGDTDTKPIIRIRACKYLAEQNLVQNKKLLAVINDIRNCPDCSQLDTIAAIELTDKLSDAIEDKELSDTASKLYVDKLKEQYGTAGTEGKKLRTKLGSKVSASKRNTRQVQK